MWSACGAPSTFGFRPVCARMSAKMSVHFRVPAEATPFGDMPPAVREFLATGFSHLAALSSESLGTIAQQVSRWLDPQFAQDYDTIASSLEADIEVVSALVPATTLLASALFSKARPLSVEKFVASAVEAHVLEREHVDAVRAFAETSLEAHRGRISDALARANSSIRIVPSYQSFETTIDLRVAAVDDRHVVTMPMVIVALTTDVQDKQLVFQMTPRDVDELRQQLSTLAERLAHCERMRTTLTALSATEKEKVDR